MSRWRIAVVVGLVLGPFVALAAIGSIHLWRIGWGFRAWWPLAACLMAGYLLGWYWQRKRRLLHPPEFDTPARFTERDAEAWKLVEARAKAAASLPADKLSEVQSYQDTAVAMAQELAAFYHPGAKDPVGDLTIPEILAVIELAAHDLSVLVDRYLPGGHLLSINDWRRARQMQAWYQTASNVYWAVAALFAPVETGVRYAASKIGLSTPLQQLQNNLFLWFYTAYVHRLGTYLIDLHSGRLRLGADRFRALFTGVDRAERIAGQEDRAEDEAVDRVGQVTVLVLGQVKAGKSSVINALLGEQRAQTDVLPLTSGIERYELQPKDVPTRLVLLDSPGYGHSGPREDCLAATREAARSADLLLLVLQARDPARRADLELLQGLRKWFEARPDLKRPPVVAVVTHIDLLSPAMEWSLPYDWQHPTRPKEFNIRDALATVRDQLGDKVSAVVPVCAAPGKVYGVEEWLLPALVGRLDEVHGVALLRCLRAEANKERIRKVFRQLLATSKEAARLAWEAFGKKGGGA
jgi:predicted GTPase